MAPTPGALSMVAVTVGNEAGFRSIGCSTPLPASAMLGATSGLRVNGAGEVSGSGSTVITAA